MLLHSLFILSVGVKKIFLLYISWNLKTSIIEELIICNSNFLWNVHNVWFHCCHQGLCRNVTGSTGVGARTHGDWWKWKSWSVRNGSLLPLQDLILPVAYLQRLPGKWSGIGQAANMSIGSPFGGKVRPSAFFKGLLLKTGDLLDLNRNHLIIMTGLLTGHCRLKGHLFKMELVAGPRCGRCKGNFVTCFSWL
jgi:hypothetical protein